MKARAVPRRRHPSLAARVRPFWMPIAALTVVVLAALGAAATWPGFYPRSVIVVGNHRVARAEILAHARIARGRSMWLQNTGAMATRITTIPQIATVTIHRIPPGTIRIAVTERQPFAILRSGTESVVVDHELRVLWPSVGDESLPELVLQPGFEVSDGQFVTARDALALRDAYDAIAGKRITVAALTLDPYGGLVATLQGGLRVLLGQQTELPQKLALVEAILTQVVRTQRRVAAIDVRAPGTPVIVYR
jgi:cell division protein FtsQ